MSAEHTPGPWFVGEDDKNGQAVVRQEHIEIATCWHHCVGSIEKEMRSNARLIAAAPELLEACRALVLYDESDDADGLVFMQRYAEAVDKARAAIAKATDAPSRRSADTEGTGQMSPNSSSPAASPILAAPASEQGEREAFEAWALEEQLAYRDQNGFWFYESGAGYLYWKGWQARASLRASPAVPVAQDERENRILRSLLREAIEYLIDAHPSGDSEFIRTCRAALSAATPPAVVPMSQKTQDGHSAASVAEAPTTPAPEGYALVPVKPTLRMMAAAGPAIRACYGLDGKNGTVSDVWAALLDAAPQPAATVSRPEFSPYNQGWKDGYKHGAWAAQPAESSKAALSDDEIVSIANETRTAEPGANGYILPISFARAILARAGIGESRHE